MKRTVVLIGAGEMGRVFAGGFLKAGYPVYPVLRGADLNEAAQEVPDPQAVVVAVGEKDLHGVLEAVPQPWRDQLVLLQNELLPRDWLSHNIENPTVISVWFEKKAGQGVKVIIPSPVFGPQADFIRTALGATDINCNVLASQDELLFELVLKNVYILTINIAGLDTGGTVGELWAQHQALAWEVAGEVMDIQFRLIEKNLDREKLIEGVVQAFNGDLEHKCMGRSAPARLARAVGQADEFGLEIKKLREIYKHKVQVPI